MNTKIVSAWPGCGKTTYVKQNKKEYIEIECWKYHKTEFPKNIITDITKSINEFKLIFISTNPIVLVAIIKLGMTPLLYYPDKSLKYEYLERYISRKSSYDFIGVFMSMWDIWLDELYSHSIKCQKVKLNSGEYLSGYL